MLIIKKNGYKNCKFDNKVQKYYLNYEISFTFYSCHERVHFEEYSPPARLLYNLSKTLCLSHILFTQLFQVERTARHFPDPKPNNSY